MKRLAALLLPALLSAGARAELWAYVDRDGVAHFASEPLNGSYSLVLGADGGGGGAAARDKRFGRVPGKQDGSLNLLTWLDIAPEVKAVQPYLREAAADHGVDPELLMAVIAVESGYKQGAVSPRGALGLMQITPQAGARYADTSEPRRLLEPRLNVQTGARMLADLIKRFGRIDAALAAWNAGEGAVRRAGGKMPPIDETQAHVHLVLELYWALLQRSRPAQALALKIHSNE
ncbi:MAG: lytic transglycosylase domain-containing protein [Burkholderiaceae bacterium]